MYQNDQYDNVKLPPFYYFFQTHFQSNISQCSTAFPDSEGLKVAVQQQQWRLAKNEGQVDVKEVHKNRGLEVAVGLVSR